MRYTDRNLAFHRHDDFVVRTRIPSIAQFAILFLVDFAVVCAAYGVSGGFYEFALITLVMLGALNGLMVYSVQRARDQMLATEFQNAIYAAALAVNNQFCLIVRKDGLIVHADVGFYAMYPQFNQGKHRLIGDVLEIANVNKAEMEKIYQMISNGSSSQHPIMMRDGEGTSYKIMLSADPLRRPADYMLLRGRTFVESRSA